MSHQSGSEFSSDDGDDIDVDNDSPTEYSSFSDEEEEEEIFDGIFDRISERVTTRSMGRLEEQPSRRSGTRRYILRYREVFHQNLVHCYFSEY